MLYIQRMTQQIDKQKSKTATFYKKSKKKSI